MEELWRELRSSLSQALPGQPALLTIFAYGDAVVAKHEHSILGLQIGGKPFLGIITVVVSGGERATTLRACEVLAESTPSWGRAKRLPYVLLRENCGYYTCSIGFGFELPAADAACCPTNWQRYPLLHLCIHGGAFSCRQSATAMILQTLLELPIPDAARWVITLRGRTAWLHEEMGQTSERFRSHDMTECAGRKQTSEGCRLLSRRLGSVNPRRPRPRLDACTRIRKHDVVSHY